MQSQNIKIGRLDIRYFSGGQGEPLVIIHGGGGGGKAWLRNAEQLSRCYSVYIPDLPGFGHSESVSDKFYLSQYVAFIEDFTQTLGLKRFHLIGHSIGGAISLQYALKFPEKVTGLVLVSSWCLGIEAALWVRLLSHPALCRSFGEAGIRVIKAVRALAPLFYAPFRFSNPLTRVKMDVGKSMISLDGQTTVLSNELPQLIMPTLLIWGSGDRTVPQKHAYAAAKLIPDCQLHVFEGCGHSVYKQRIPDFSRVVLDFLGS